MLVDVLSSECCSRSRGYVDALLHPTVGGGCDQSICVARDIRTCIFRGISLRITTSEEVCEYVNDDIKAWYVAT